MQTQTDHIGRSVLYHGYNGLQEFWDGDDFLFIRCRDSQTWTASKREAGGGSSTYLFDGADHHVLAMFVRERLKREIVFDRTQEWRKVGGGFKLKKMTPSFVVTGYLPRLVIGTIEWCKTDVEIGLAVRRWLVAQDKERTVKVEWKAAP